MNVEEESLKSNVPCEEEIISNRIASESVKE